MFLSYEREDMALAVLENNMANVGSDKYELMITDQGSNNINFLNQMQERFKPVYFRRNLYNEGIARSLNQMAIRRSHEHVMFMPNDIMLPPDWLKIALEYISDIPASGVVGFEGQALKLPEYKTKGTSGKEYLIGCERQMLLEGCQVYGATIFTKKLIEKVGYLCEEYGPYGWEDQDICFRSQFSALFNYYIIGLCSNHIGLNDDDIESYRVQKHKMLTDSVGHFRWRTANLARVGMYTPAPIKKEPYT